jgi:hypothetical protein
MAFADHCFGRIKCLIHRGTKAYYVRRNESSAVFRFVSTGIRIWVLWVETVKQSNDDSASWVPLFALDLPRHMCSTNRQVHRGGYRKHHLQSSRSHGSLSLSGDILAAISR